MEELKTVLWIPDFFLTCNLDEYPLLCTLVSNTCIFDCRVCDNLDHNSSTVQLNRCIWAGTRLGSNSYILHSNLCILDWNPCVCCIACTGAFWAGNVLKLVRFRFELVNFVLNVYSGFIFVHLGGLCSCNNI